MNVIIDFCKGTLQVPFKFEAVVFVFFEPLKLFDKVNLELRTNPHPKLKCNIGMCIGAAVSACRSFQTYCIRFFDPFFYTQSIAV